MRVKLPTWATVALSTLAGVLSLLNVTVFGLDRQWQELVTIACPVLAALGISPLTGPALQTALHLSHGTVLALTSAFTTATIAVTTLSIDPSIKGVITGLLALTSGVLFGTRPAAAAPPAPVAVPPPATSS